MAFNDTYRESIQSKHISGVGFSSTAKGATNESFATKNPHQVLATQIPVIDVIGTYGPLTASGIAANLVEQHTVKLTADPTVNGNKAWLAYESDCTETGHAARGAVRLDQWMRYANTQYKARIFADNGGALDPAKEILPSEVQFNWEYDASAGVVYFDADPTTFGFPGRLWATIYTYVGETLFDKVDTTVSGGGKSFLNITDGIETATASTSDDTLTFSATGGLSVAVDGTGKIVTISGSSVASRQEANLVKNGTHWDHNGGFSIVPGDLVVYYNGVKQKGSDAEYYTTAVNGGVLQVTPGFDTYAEDWFSIEWNESYQVAGGLKVWAEKLAAYTCVSGDRVIVNTSTVPAYTINLPANPVTGSTVSFFDGGGNCGTVNVTLGRNGKNIMGLAQDLLIDTDNASFEVIFYNEAQGWRIVE